MILDIPDSEWGYFSDHTHLWTPYPNPGDRGALAGYEVILADNVEKYFEEVSGYAKAAKLFATGASIEEHERNAAQTGIAAPFESVVSPLCIAPPFPQFYIEYGYPAAFLRTFARPAGPFLHSYGTDAGRRVRLGLFFDAYEIREKVAARMARRFGGEYKWQVTAFLYVEFIPGKVAGPIFTMRLLISPEGELRRFLSVPVAKFPNPEGGLWNALGMAAIYPALMTLDFMYEERVVVSVVPEKPRPAVKGKHRRRERHFIRHRVLDIHPLQQVLRTENKVHEVGLERAWHRVRRHRKVYSVERPLFGIYTGQMRVVWAKAHKRGNIKQGIAIKDYRVHPPAKEAS